MSSASFISDHMHTMRSGQRWSVDHRQACDGRLFGHIIQPTLHYIASVVRTLYSVKENTRAYALGQSGRAGDVICMFASPTDRGQFPVALT